MSHTLTTLIKLNLTLDDVQLMTEEELQYLLEYIHMTRPVV